MTMKSKSVIRKHLVGLATLGFNIPALRQIVGFIFLTFVPRILILRILRIHNVGTIESLAYSAGLNLAFVMFTGAFINFVLPFEKTKIDKLMLEGKLEFQLADVGIVIITDKRKITIEFDKERLRPTEVPILLTKTTKIQELDSQIIYHLKDIANATSSTIS